MCLASACERMEARAEMAGVVGFDFLTIITTILTVIQGCKSPIPPAPVESPTPAQAKAWELKCRAIDAYNPDEADYERAAVHKAANAIRRAKKKNGERISRAEAVTISTASFDEARMSSFEDLAKAVEEAGA